MENLTLINGNNQTYNIDLPTILMLGEINDVAMNHIFENTGLKFETTSGGYTCKPETSQQIVKLFLTYNFKTRYYNNAMYHNTLMIKSDHHIGFDVDSICYNCCKHNHIPINGLKSVDRIMC